MGYRQESEPTIVVLGGGNGASEILRGLAETGLGANTTAIQTVYDDGGSTGMLRKANPALPAPGDIRRGLAALATDKSAAEEFNRRRSDGHVIGNLALAELTEEFGSFDQAVTVAADRLGVVGRVLPSSKEASTLVMEHMGERVVGEHTIGGFRITDPWAKISLHPPVEAHPGATKAINDAHMVVIAPGSLYTSLNAALAPEGMKEALENSKATMVAVANLQAEEAQTPKGWRVADHVLALEDLIRRPFDYILHHTGGLPDGTQPLDAGASSFYKISGRVIGLPMAAVRERDGRIVHDGKIVAIQLGQLLAQHQFVHKSKETPSREGVSRDLERSVSAR